MKKSLLFLITLTLVFSLAGCFKKQVVEEVIPEVEGVPETGRVLDISDKTGQTATVTPGDVLYLKLSAGEEELKQWSVTAPTSGNYLLLTDHKGEEWWLKIEETGAFDLEFDFGDPGEEADDTFSLHVVSE